MKKIIGLLLGAAFLGIGAKVSNGLEIMSGKGVSKAYAEVEAIETIQTIQPQTDLNIRAKSAYLMDFNTQTTMYAQNETSRLPIASMCKIMTLILCFDAIDNDALSLDEEITVSERAASMGGSQVFLESNAKYRASELIKSIVVCSANDSCVAMAERLAGSENLFVDKMNEKARELGAMDTLFANCTGLPKEPQYSCAKDVAIMLKNLLTHEEYYQFGKVWMDKFQHPEGRYTEITNTNKLVRFYDGCDGGKTGFTNEAGFCLAATAKRNDMRIISVVIGEENSANRFDDVRTMFDYAFANYVMTPVIEGGVPLQKAVRVNGGKDKTLKIYPERSAYVFEKRGEKSDVTTELRLQKLTAPIKRSQKVGDLVVYKNGIETDRVALLAESDIKKGSFFDSFKDIAGEWNAR